MTNRKQILYVLVFCVAASPVFGQVLTETADWDRNDGTKVAGSFDFSNDVYTIQANGNDIWDATDEGFYVYTEQAGDWSIGGQVTWIDTGSGTETPSEWAKVGPMIRDNAQDPQAVNAFAAARGAGDMISPQWRLEPGIASGSYDPRIEENGEDVGLVDSSIWLRVTRFADMDIVVYEWSRDGQAWNFGYAQQVPMAETVAYGFAVTNHQGNEELAEAEVANVELAEAAPITAAVRDFSVDNAFEGDTFEVTITIANPQGTLTETVPELWTVDSASNDGTVSGNTITWELDETMSEVTYQVQVISDVTMWEVPATGFSGDVNGNMTGGEHSLNFVYDAIGPFDWQLSMGDASDNLFPPEEFDGTLQVFGSGSDIWGTADNCHFMYTEMTGNFSIRASLTLLQEEGDATWAKGGLMIRNSIANNDVNAFAMLQSEAGQLRMQYRPEQGSDSSNTSAVDASEHNGYVELTRIGDTVATNYFDPNTGETTTVASQSLPNLNDTVLVGLAITSHTDGMYSILEASEIEFLEYDVVATRSIPAPAVSKDGGMIEDVQVTAHIGEGTSSETITETLPEGFVAQNVETTNGNATVDGNVITWELDAASGTVTMTYDASHEPITDRFAVNFSGQVGELAIAGDSGLKPIAFEMPYVPEADIEMDGQLDAAYEQGYAETFAHEEGDTTPPGVVINGTTYPADENNATFHVLHTDENIYVAIDVVDPSLAFDVNETEPWNNDSVEFNFDGNFSRSSDKEDNSLGFQASIVGNGRITGGDASFATEDIQQGDGYAYTDSDNYWNFATRVKDDQSGWITEIQLDKEQVLEPDTIEYVGFDIKFNGVEQGDTERTSTWGYWYTNMEGSVQDAYWSNEQGWAVVRLQGQETPVTDWLLF